MVADSTAGATFLDRDLAAALDDHEAGRLSDAVAGYQRVLDRDPDNADALHLMGVAETQRGAAATGVALIEQAVARDGDRADVYANLAKALREVGRPEDAVAAAERACGLAPTDPEMMADLGVLYHLQLRIDDAEAAFRRTVTLDPNFARGRYNLGATLKARGALGPALQELEAALRLEPANIDARFNIAAILIAQGEAEAALEVLRASLELAPGHAVVLAYMALALNELGRQEDCGALLGLDTLVRPFRLSAPAPYPDMEAFNRALANHILAQAEVMADPELQATRNGLHTGQLLREPLGPIAPFHAAVTEALKSYVRELPSLPGHPFTGRRPVDVDTSMWAVVMNSGGHQLPHIHGDAYVSGVYYPRVPTVVDSAGVDHDGWIEFGRPSEEFCCRAEPMLRLIKPEEGLLVLFPSYVYHRTVPFRSNQQRISIAFDFVEIG